jgi:hypothetical protein
MLSESPEPSPTRRRHFNLPKGTRRESSKYSGANPTNSPLSFEKVNATICLFEPKAFHQEPSHSGVEKIDDAGFSFKMFSQAGILSSSCAQE